MRNYCCEARGDRYRRACDMRGRGCKWQFIASRLGGTKGTGRAGRAERHAKRQPKKASQYLDTRGFDPAAVCAAGECNTPTFPGNRYLVWCAVLDYRLFELLQ